MIDHEPTDEVIQEAAHMAATSDIDPSGDIHATGEFRRHLAEVLVARGIRQAIRRAGERAGEAQR